MTGSVVKNVLAKLLPERHSKKDQPESAVAVNVKVSPGLAEALVMQSPGLEEGEQTMGVIPVCSMVTDPCPVSTTSMPAEEITNCCEMAALLRISKHGTNNHLRTRNKVKISYRITCAFDGLELNVQCAGVELVSHRQKECWRRQNRVVFLQRVQHRIGKNRLVS